MFAHQWSTVSDNNGRLPAGIIPLFNEESRWGNFVYRLLVTRADIDSSHQFAFIALRRIDYGLTESLVHVPVYVKLLTVDVFAQSKFNCSEHSTPAGSMIQHIKIQHIYTTTQQRKCLHFNCLTLLHHIRCAQKWRIWLYAALLCFYSLMVVSCGPKHVRNF
jgi:hypothetical protein